MIKSLLDGSWPLTVRKAWLENGSHHIYIPVGLFRELGLTARSGPSVRVSVLVDGQRVAHGALNLETRYLTEVREAFRMLSVRAEDIGRRHILARSGVTAAGSVCIILNGNAELAVALQKAA